MHRRETRLPAQPAVLLFALSPAGIQGMVPHVPIHLGPGDGEGSAWGMFLGSREQGACTQGLM